MDPLATARARLEALASLSTATTAKRDLDHALDVESLAQELYGDAPLALRIAALYHDVDRFTPQRVDTSGTDYDRLKLIHSGMCAIIACQMLSDLPETLVRDVGFLILCHEHGRAGLGRTDEHTGTYDLHEAAEVLFFADKLSFFSTWSAEYADRGEEALRRKVRFTLKGLPSGLINRVLEMELDVRVREAVDEHLRAAHE